MQTELPPHKPQDAEWGREMKNKRQLTSFALSDWVVVFPKREAQTSQSLVVALQRVCPQMGMQVGFRCSSVTIVLFPSSTLRQLCITKRLCEDTESLACRTMPYTEVPNLENEAPQNRPSQGRMPIPRGPRQFGGAGPPNP